MSPVRQVATASMNVVMPNVAWIGTNEARKAAVAPSQHSRIRKLKKPTTNCGKKKKTCMSEFKSLNVNILIFSIKS